MCNKGINMQSIISVVLRPSVAFMERLRLRAKFIVTGIVGGIVVSYLLLSGPTDGVRLAVALAGLALTGYLSLGAYVSVLGAVRTVAMGGKKIAALALAVTSSGRI